MTSLERLPRRLAVSALGRLDSWSEGSQLGARRNAMVACTALAARRAEREDVADFFEARDPRERDRRDPRAARR